MRQKPKTQAFPTSNPHPKPTTALTPSNQPLLLTKLKIFSNNFKWNNLLSLPNKQRLTNLSNLCKRSPNNLSERLPISMQSWTCTETKHQATTSTQHLTWLGNSETKIKCIKCTISSSTTSKFNISKCSSNSECSNKWWPSSKQCPNPRSLTAVSSNKHSRNLNRLVASSPRHSKTRSAIFSHRQTTLRKRTLTTMGWSIFPVCLKNKEVS